MVVKEFMSGSMFSQAFLLLILWTCFQKHLQDNTLAEKTEKVNGINEIFNEGNVPSEHVICQNQH